MFSYKQIGQSTDLDQNEPDQASKIWKVILVRSACQLWLRNTSLNFHWIVTVRLADLGVKVLDFSGYLGIWHILNPDKN